MAARSVSGNAAYLGTNVQNSPLVEFATLTLDAATKVPKAKIYRPSEIDALLKKHDLAKKDEDAEMASA